MPALRKRGRAANPLTRLEELRADLERVEVALAETNGERASTQAALGRIPERARAAHVRDALDRGDGEMVAAVRAEELELRARAAELQDRADALAGEYRKAEQAIADHYAANLDYFAVEADALTEEAIVARDRLIAALEDAERAWVAATRAWSPVVAGATATGGAQVNYVAPPPYDGAKATLRLWANMAPRPAQVAPGGVLPTAEEPWPGARPPEVAA